MQLRQKGGRHRLRRRSAEKTTKSTTKMHIAQSDLASTGDVMVYEEPCKKTKKDASCGVSVGCGVNMDIGGQENNITKDPHYPVTNSDFITQAAQITKAKENHLTDLSLHNTQVTLQPITMETPHDVENNNNSMYKLDPCVMEVDPTFPVPEEEEEISEENEIFYNIPFKKKIKILEKKINYLEKEIAIQYTSFV
ncbi:hypothetical protein MAR_003535 [Mya arenaria]|uniref:Uncharacterized protein n=1 Tax=Mya arenaria TaxID=6604 RepID=A0ABY7G9E6_MYAAR|nr:hypothetical protein MAR_003535 [Mya arenaria]